MEHGVDEAWRRRDRPVFADAFYADRVGGRGRLLKQRSYVWHMFGARHRIVEQRAGHQLPAIGIVADIFVERLRDALHHAPMNLSAAKHRIDTAAPDSARY